MRQSYRSETLAGRLRRLGAIASPDREQLLLGIEGKQLLRRNVFFPGMLLMRGHLGVVRPPIPLDRWEGGTADELAAAVRRAAEEES